ncbi:MAG: hypothetical protein ACK4S4_03295 [Pyrinomonadaceae bacterium]
MKLALQVISLLLVAGPFAMFAQPPSAPVRYSAPDINGRATLLVRPVLPADVTLANDGMTIALKVVVDGEGNVVSAQCSAALPQRIRKAAEAAAAESKFRPMIVNGEAVSYTGTLLYTIAVERVNWFRFGTALYSTFIFDNISLGPVAAMLTPEFADEKTRLQELDNGVELAVRWRTIEGVRRSLSDKLKGQDAWWFELGMAIREATAPFQSDRKPDRAELQRALAALARFADSAPGDVPRPVVQAIRDLSDHKIDPAMPLPELARLIFEMSRNIRPVDEPQFRNR